jgi:SAM-dependent methyltransferase
MMDQAAPSSGYPWPALQGAARPQWTGDGFLVGGKRVGVLTYSGGESGWSASLTRLHENAAGTNHPIDELSKGWALSALGRHMAKADGVLLEVGCSSGFLLTALHDRWPAATVMGSDFLPEPLEALAARQPEIPLLQFDLVQCPLPDASVDAVVMLNVLEHIKDDGGAVRQVARILKPGGIAVVEVPAGPHLFDPYDEYLQHERRYTAQGFKTLLESSGLSVIERSHLGFSVYPAFVMVKRQNQKRGAVSSEARREIVEKSIASTRSGVLMRLALHMEAWAGQYISYPVGIRCVAVARKRSPA